MTDPEWLVDGLEWMPVGSRVTCSPPPTDTDEDFLVFDRWSRQTAKLRKLGFRTESADKYSGKLSQFFSYRKGDTNVIVTGSREFYTRFVEATKLATTLNLMDKEDRISLFKYVLYNQLEN
tara:strand:+ start:393 stop:755 length:363 start_codon:yes stop_codon:yes gene_type:complete